MRSPIADWAAKQYPTLPAVILGASGAVLIDTFLRQSTRRTVIAPAFICPEVPLVIKRAGKQLWLVDVHRETMHMKHGLIESLLSKHDPSDVIVLIDHSFGYPDPLAARIKLAHPGVTLIEDCVRSLGAEIDGRPVGSDADWVLFSMYKTTLGNDEGAVLLGPVSLDAATVVRPLTVRQVVSALSIPRGIHRWLQRYTARVDELEAGLEEPRWSAVHGLPNRLTSQRFADQLASLEADRQRREAVFHHLAAEMKIYPDIEPIKPASHCRPAAYYLSFVFKAKGARDVFANAMLRHGLPVVWAWNSVPAHYRCFSENAIGGSGGSEYLAAHVCHIPLTEYVSHRRQQRLIALLTSSEWHARR